MTRNLTTLILLLLCGAGTLFAQYYPYPDMGHATVDGVTYYYDRNVGARILQTSGSNVKHDYVDVSDDHYICYENDKGTKVCDSMYYCYVQCFDADAKSITLPEKVLLPC